MYLFNYAVKYTGLKMNFPQDDETRLADARKISSALGERVLVYPVVEHENEYLYFCIALNYRYDTLTKLVRKKYNYRKMFVDDTIARYGELIDGEEVNISVETYTVKDATPVIQGKWYRSVYAKLEHMLSQLSRCRGISWFNTSPSGTAGGMAGYRRTVVKSCRHVLRHMRTANYALPVRFSYSIEGFPDYGEVVDCLLYIASGTRRSNIVTSTAVRIDVASYSDNGELSPKLALSSFCSGLPCILTIDKDDDIEKFTKLLCKLASTDVTTVTFVLVFEDGCSDEMKDDFKSAFHHEIRVPMFEIKNDNFYSYEEAMEELDMQAFEYRQLQHPKKCKSKRHYKWKITNTGEPIRYEEILDVFEEWRRRYEYRTCGKITNKTKGLYRPAKKKATVTKDNGKSLIKGLDDLIGLKEVKAQVEEIVAYHKMVNVYKDKGLKIEAPSLHMAFYGNPGTAKTTCAKIIGDIFAKAGIIDGDRFVKVSRGDLVGEYVGKTAPKTQACIDKARGGVLFIDEAYTLSHVAGDSDYGSEALATLVEQLDIIRHDTVVIFAGYEDRMKELIKTNEGLNSRIAYHMTFRDYTHSELMAILETRISNIGFELEDGVKDILSKRIKTDMNGKDFGNGRYIRNLVDKTVIKHSTRLYNTDNPSDTEIKTITKEDIGAVINKLSDENVIGFGVR